MISLSSGILEVIKKFRPFARKTVSIWVNCLEDRLITNFFLCIMLVALFVTLLLLYQKTSYTNFDESFPQDGIPQVL